MENNKNKILAFEYVLFGLVKWYQKSKNIDSFIGFNENNDLNKLKVIKLHFFVSAVDESGILLSVFDRFYAMPYGHVESDIYNHISNLSNFSVSEKKLIINDPSSINQSCFNDLEKTTLDAIDSSIEKLKQYNPILIDYTAIQLVDLSHQWFSWQSMFTYARQNNRFSEKIPNNIILDEVKIFELT